MYLGNLVQDDCISEKNDLYYDISSYDDYELDNQ